MTASTENDPPSLDQLRAAFALAPHDVQVLDPEHRYFDATRPLLVLPRQFQAAPPLIRHRYPAGHRARVLSSGGTAHVTIEDLPGNVLAWLIEPLAPEDDARSPNGLRAIMERLCAPDGCPWDREQTHESLRRYVIEEAYELVDAIDRADLEGLREELGDVLMHVVMHAALAQERGEFTFEQVVEGITRKMVRRHPHIFGDEEAGSTEQLWERWDQIKAAERAEAAPAGTVEAGALDSVPRAAPALQRAQSLQRRATRAGALEPALEPLEELKMSVATLGPEPSSREVGALLWAAVRLAASGDVDAEEALRERSHEFAAAFTAIENRARHQGVAIGELGDAERRAPWVAPSGHAR